MMVPTNCLYVVFDKGVPEKNYTKSAQTQKYRSSHLTRCPSYGHPLSSYCAMSHYHALPPYSMWVLVVVLEGYCRSFSSTPACCMRSPMDFSRSSIRFPISSIR